MKSVLTFAAIALTILSTAGAANAKGCLKGAVVGGIAGHYAGHHGIIGAAAGCAYGRHEANKQQRFQPSNADNSDRKIPKGQQRM